MKVHELEKLKRIIGRRVLQKGLIEKCLEIGIEYPSFHEFYGESYPGCIHQIEYYKNRQTKLLRVTSISGLLMEVNNWGREDKALTEELPKVKIKREWFYILTYKSGEWERELDKIISLNKNGKKRAVPKIIKQNGKPNTNSTIKDYYLHHYSL